MKKSLQLLVCCVLATALMVSTVARAQEKTPSNPNQISQELIEAWLALQQKPRKVIDPDAPPKPPRPDNPDRKPIPRPKRLVEPVHRVPITAERVIPIKVEEKDGTINQLLVAVCTYTKGDVTLDVIGTVHIADAGYYRMLNERFQRYDALCYELVAPEGKKPQKDERSLMRNLVNVFLELEHQLAVVDYHADNFVHADLTPEKFEAVMAKYGDDMMTIALSTIADLMRQYNKSKGAKVADDAPLMKSDMVQIIGNPNGAVEMKRMMAQQFVDNDDVSASFGTTLTKYIVDERNIAALEVVEEQAKTKKSLGLYYGAAHLPDFDARLRQGGWTRTKISYDVAWDNLAHNQDELEYLFKLLQGLDEK